MLFGGVATAVHGQCVLEEIAPNFLLSVIELIAGDDICNVIRCRGRFNDVISKRNLNSRRTSVK